MRKIIVALAATLFATAAYAYCRTYTIIADGKVMVCTECCTGNVCTLTCT